MWEQVKKVVNKSLRVTNEAVKDATFNRVYDASKRGYFKLSDAELAQLRDVLFAGIDDGFEKTQRQFDSSLAALQKEIESTPVVRSSRK